MKDLMKNMETLSENIPKGVCLVAVSKTHPVEDIKTLYDGGCRVFGENKVQELVDKAAVLPRDIEWHLIGHLQRNKVKYIASFVHLIHSIDSFELLKTVDKEGRKCGRIVDCLLQFHIAEEDTKYGLSREEAEEFLGSREFAALEYVRIRGVMGMATNTDEMSTVRREFRCLRNIFTEIKEKFFKDKDYFKEISMGMSGDYPVAIEEGSTMVRIGSAIFGLRDYTNK